MMRNKVVLTALGFMFSASVLGAGADERDSVLIKRGPVEITDSEYRLLTNSILNDAQREALFGEEERLRELLLDYFVTRSLAQEAVDMGLDQSPEIQFQQQYNELRHLAQIRLQHLQKEAQERDYEALAREFYVAERPNFKIPPRVSVEHVLVAVNSERNASAAQERIKEVEAKLEAGTDFASLVAEYSDDPSAAGNKGNLGYFGRDQMVKPFEEAAFAMTEAGETTIVQTDFGYHLIRYVGREDERVRSFDEVKDELIDQQRQLHLGSLRNKKIQDVRQSSDIVVDFDAVSAFFADGQKRLQETE